jgi:Flp pilus assembly protein TadG
MKPNPKRIRPLQRRRGAVTVEMAITLPIVFLIVLTAVEFGRLNVIRHTLDNSAYEAARKAIVPGSTAQDAEQEARRIMDIVGAQGVDVQITPAVLDIDTPEVNVNVSVDFGQNGFITPFFFAGKRITGNVTMRREDL